MKHSRQAGTFDTLIRILLPVIGGFIGLVASSILLWFVVILVGQWSFIQDLLWVFIGTSVFAGLVAGVVLPTRIWRAHRCSACEYNLKGNTSGRCPECGSPV